MGYFPLANASIKPFDLDIPCINATVLTYDCHHVCIYIELLFLLDALSICDLLPLTVYAFAP